MTTAEPSLSCADVVELLNLPPEACCRHCIEDAEEGYSYWTWMQTPSGGGLNVTICCTHDDRIKSQYGVSTEEEVLTLIKQALEGKEKV